jgi:hypothetical protein
MNEDMKTRIKQWIEDHKENIIVGAAWAGFAGVFVGLCVVVVKQAQAEVAAETIRANVIREAIGRRDLILPMRDGSFLLIPHQD